MSTIAFQQTNVENKELGMAGKATRGVRRGTRNLTAKHGPKFNKSMVHVDRKNAMKQGYQKHRDVLSD